MVFYARNNMEDHMPLFCNQQLFLFFYVCITRTCELGSGGFSLYSGKDSAFSFPLFPKFEHCKIIEHSHIIDAGFELLVGLSESLSVKELAATNSGSQPFFVTRCQSLFKNLFFVLNYNSWSFLNVFTFIEKIMAKVHQFPCPFYKIIYNYLLKGR